MRKSIMTTNVISPCKDCPDRYPGCHGDCEKYADYRAKVDRQRESLKSTGWNPLKRREYWADILRKKKGR